MALSAGSVSIADDGTVTGTGLARAIYDQFAALAPAVTLVPPLPADFLPRQAAMRVEAARGYALMANAVAAGLVPYLQANAQVSIAKDALDAGVPSVNRTSAGTIT